MNKEILINNVAMKTGMSKAQAQAAIEATIEEIKGALVAGDKVQLIGFGSFAVKERGARKVRNPQTGKEMKVKACKVPAFRPGQAFKDEVNKPKKKAAPKKAAVKKPAEKKAAKPAAKKAAKKK